MTCAKLKDQHDFFYLKRNVHVRLELFFKILKLKKLKI